MSLPNLHDLRRILGNPFGLRSKPVGAPPGTLVAFPDALPPTLTVFAYGPDALVEKPIDRVAEAETLRKQYPVLWLDVTGLGDTKVLEEVGRAFDIHPLALEDVLSPRQRMKVEEYPQGTFVIARMFHRLDDLVPEQLAFVLGEGYVVSFQQMEGDCFNPIRDRLRQSVGRIRASGPDHLLYALLDAVVDSCFPLLEGYQADLEELEDAIIADARPEQMARLMTLRKDFAVMRRALWPAREALLNLLRGDHPRIKEDTRLFLRDTEDHVLRLMELQESIRDVATGLTDLYLNFVSHRMNETMKVLTIIATIFIPLSFIAGLYGMNFDPEISAFNMPELGWRFGYPMALGVMLLIACAMLILFWRKGWLGRGRP